MAGAVQALDGPHVPGRYLRLSLLAGRGRSPICQSDDSAVGGQQSAGPVLRAARDRHLHFPHLRIALMIGRVPSLGDPRAEATFWRDCLRDCFCGTALWNAGARGDRGSIAFPSALFFRFSSGILPTDSPDAFWGPENHFARVHWRINSY